MNIWNEILENEGITGDSVDSPFTCQFNGFPDKCDVVFIGKEPKNDLKVKWSVLWDKEIGFQHQRFEEIYEQVVSRTSFARTIYREIASMGYRSLETNAFLNGKKDNYRVLRALLDNLPRNKPIGIIPFRIDAKRFMRQYTVPDSWKVFYRADYRIRTISNLEKEQMKLFIKSLR